MADWYVSSAAYTAIATYAASHAYSIGDIVKPTAPASLAKYAFRCTTAGTSSTEPTWPTGNNSTVTTGGATFTNITGQSTYGWSAAAGDFPTINNVPPTRLASGDRVYLSSDHTETSNTNWGANFSSGYGTVYYLCVNRAGSVPPVAADLTTGASLTSTAFPAIFAQVCNSYHYGMTFNSAIISWGSGAQLKTSYFKNCKFQITSTIFGANNTGTVILDNTKFEFSNTGCSIDLINGTGAPELIWTNTPSAIVGATIPTVLFLNTFGLLVTCRGVDLSAITTTLVAASGSRGSKFLFDSCKIASGVTRYGSGTTNTRDVVELVNCYDGTNIISECYQPPGAVTTEFSITLNAGAADNVGAYSHKMVSNANADKAVEPLRGFWMDCNYTTTGSSKTATVEIISSASLNNDEIALYLQYEGTASSSVASFADSFIATPLTAAAAVTSSSVTWNSSPSTPVKQKLQVTFTPQVAGRVRGQVRLGKASATVYVNPQITIT